MPLRALLEPIVCLWPDQSLPQKRIWAAIIFPLMISGCHRDETVVLAEQLAGGKAGLGRELIYAYGCGTCHNVPGVPEAQGTTGPPLARFAHRSYVAGTLTNTPENLIRWIREPQKIEPRTAMPQLGVSDEQAHHIAAYLYTLR